jgi:hypothetical protein
MNSAIVCVLCSQSMFRFKAFIHKSVKHFKNSQQINYASDHGNSYADRK